jgi:endogenous inhibitor of DNA gyrase (YacG/DUF329 family)
MVKRTVCVICGKVFTDTSASQNKMTCSAECKRIRFNLYRKQKKESESECPYNMSVSCTDHMCGKCGWNPKVEKARKEALA